jgi:mannose-1-phosphate guanylyltransferase / mannose-6-phosphate isomerase
MNIQPVILCGGSGTRLWPLSREQYPKQLLNLVGNHTMLQATALRLADLALDPGGQLLPPLLVGNEEYRFLMAQQMQEIGVAHAPILLEPCGRNTAPALTLAALSASDDTLLVVMPADHIIQDQAPSSTPLQAPCAPPPAARSSPSASSQRHRKPAMAISRSRTQPPPPPRTLSTAS